VYVREVGVNHPIRVVIVDTDGTSRQMARRWFEGVSDILVAGEGPGGQDIIGWLVHVQPDVVLMDVRAATAAQVRAVVALARVVVIHEAGQEALVLEALRAGALGNLDRQNVRPPQAVAAVRTVSRGEAVLSPALAGRIVEEVVGRQRKYGQ